MVWPFFNGYKKTACYKTYKIYKNYKIYMICNYKNLQKVRRKSKIV